MNPPQQQQCSCSSIRQGLAQGLLHQFACCVLQLLLTMLVFPGAVSVEHAGGCMLLLLLLLLLLSGPTHHSPGGSSTGLSCR
jgi:hypothetical protein